LAVIEAIRASTEGLTVPQMAQALTGEDPSRDELEATLQRIVDSLVQYGLLRRIDDESIPGPTEP
jgi:hypothetical protein